MSNIQDRDEQRLAELGYKQDLSRAWSSFSNFAISFTIISVLAGCFTTYGQAWNNGGPIAISWAWPIIAAIILIIAFCMSELVSAYPTAGGPYWWAAKLGGPGWAWFTGWFNVIGLIAVVASVDYAAANFASALFNSWGLNLGVIDFSDSASLSEVFVVFIVFMALHALINIYSSHLVALFNNISVFWHVAGVAVIIAILAFVPDHHQSVNFVFTEKINNSGFGMSMFWYYVLPLGFLLTMYTITGYDASAHVAEETHDAEMAAARGIWQSVFYSAIIGWFVLLAITFAATDTKAAAGGAIPIFQSAMSKTPADTRDPHLHDRPVLLRHGLRDELLAHVLRVLARPRRARLAAVELGRQAPRPGRRRDRRVRVRGDHDAPGAVERRRHRPPGRVLRGRLDLGHRPLHRLRRARVPPAARGRQLRPRRLDARREVQVDVHRLGGLGDPDGDHLQPPVHPGSRVLERRVRLEGRQLRAADGRRAVHRGRHLVAGRAPRTRSTGRCARSSGTRAPASSRTSPVETEEPPPAAAPA